MNPRIAITLLALAVLPSLASAQFYDVSLVRADNGSIQNMVYDNNSTSYKDNSIENPDVLLRICTTQQSDLLGKWVALAYADGSDGDYLLVTHTSMQVTSVLPNGCANMPLDIDSFKAWYPSIPYVFVSDMPSLDGAIRTKLSRSRGWFIGNYTVNRIQTGNQVNITVANSTDDTRTTIIPDVNYLVIGLVRSDFTTMDTVISNPYESNILMSDGGTYTIFINGIGPDMPPYVKILTPENKTYDSGNRPFTYIITDDEEVSSCWYVLDGVTVTMPRCDVAYILNVGQGTHTLTLYGKDSSGNVGFDTVKFMVGKTSPPGGGGGTQTPYPQPIIPPPPPGLYFSLTPEDIYVIIDYPNEGMTEFNLTSNADLYNLNCFVRGDFERWTTVELDSDSIIANGTIHGTITVSMSPQEILDYNLGTKGILQCTGSSDPTLVSSALANVYLIIHKPKLDMENKTFEALPGAIFNGTAIVYNTGEGNATAVNISGKVRNYPFLIDVYDWPHALPHNGDGLVRFTISIPDDMSEGTNVIIIDFYENNRKIGEGQIVVRVLPRLVPERMCTVPDLRWTVLILIIGILAGIVVFRKKFKERHKDEREHTEHGKRYSYRR